MKKNIVMIGMPGSGKSTIGKLLAEKLNMTAVDGDSIIEEKEGMKLQEIINTKGNDYFTKLEEKVLSEIDCEGLVLCPGGSVCYYPSVMEHFNDIATVVYLKVSFEELEKRVDNLDTRGIVFKPGQSFKDLYDERTPIYEQSAAVIIDSTGESPTATVNRLLYMLK